MSLSNYLEDTLLTYITSTYTSIYVKLHVGDPGETGTANASGETDRKLVTFAAPSSGTMTSTNTPEWTNWKAGNVGETITHFSLWDASTAGNCLGYGAANTVRTMAQGDHYKITTLTWSLD